MCDKNRAFGLCRWLWPLQSGTSSKRSWLVKLRVVQGTTRGQQGGVTISGSQPHSTRYNTQYTRNSFSHTLTKIESASDHCTLENIALTEPPRELIGVRLSQHPHGLSIMCLSARSDFKSQSPKSDFYTSARSPSTLYTAIASQNKSM